MPAMSFPPTRFAAAAALLSLVAVVGCRQAPDEATIEASAAAALKAHGARDAAVDVGSGGFKATITQGDGREQKVELGVQAVAPADFALPYYPGANADPDRTSRMASADGVVSTVVLQSPDAVPQVIEFYRQHARELAQAGSAPTLEVPGAAGATSFVVAEEASGRATQVHVAPAGPGSEITLLSTRRVAR